MAEKKSPCCQPQNGIGVDNDAYEESQFNDDAISGDEFKLPDSNRQHHFTDSHKQRHLAAPQPVKEEIGLAGMNYRQLCNCEEGGMLCACSAKVSPGGPNIRIETWGRCKCISLGVCTVVACVWLVVYLTLNLAGII